MSRKSYEIPEDTPITVGESAVAYATNPSVSTEWNPNVPFHGTQEEWREHYHRIEEGNFMTLEEFDLKFETWRKEFLASRLK